MSHNSTPRQAKVRSQSPEIGAEVRSALDYFWSPPLFGIGSDSHGLFLFLGVLLFFAGRSDSLGAS